MAKIKRLRSLGDILSSAEAEAVVMGIAHSIAANVSDPNPQVEATLRVKAWRKTRGRTAPRVVGQVGMAPWLRGVEAKRGPIARAVGASRV